MMKNLPKVRYHPPAKLVHRRRGPWHLYFNPDTLAWIKTNDAGHMVIETLKTVRTASASQIAEDISLKTELDFEDI